MLALSSGQRKETSSTCVAQGLTDFDIIICLSPSALSLDVTGDLLFVVNPGAEVICNNTIGNLCLNSSDHILLVAAFSALKLVELLSAIHGTVCVEGKLNWPEIALHPDLSITCLITFHTTI